MYRIILRKILKNKNNLIPNNLNYIYIYLNQEIYILYFINKYI